MNRIYQCVATMVVLLTMTGWANDDLPMNDLVSSAGPANAALAGTDAVHTGFVTQMAPDLPPAPLRLYPRQADNQYEFKPQEARSTFLIGRFPPFELGRQKLIMFGPNYTDTNLNLYVSRGMIPRALDVSKMPGAKPQESYHIVYGGLRDDAAVIASQTNNYPLELRREAGQWAARYYFQVHQIPIPLDITNAIEDESIFTTNMTVLETIGRHAYGFWKNSDGGLGGARYVMMDIESGRSKDWLREVSLLVAGSQNGMLKAYQDDASRPALPPAFVTYAIWSFDVHAHDASHNVGGLPAYYNGYPVAFQNPELFDTLRGGAISMDCYLKCVWPDDADFLQRDEMDHVVLNDGKSQWNRTKQTLVFAGKTFPIDGNEGEHLMREIYCGFGKIQAMLWHMNGNQYPELTTSRSELCRDVQLATWERHTQEGGSYITPVENPANDRPLPPWLIEGQALMKMFLSRIYVHWGAGFEQVPGQASDYGDIVGSGVREFVVKAAHRTSLVKDAYDADGQWVWFKHCYLDRNEVEGEYVHQKPIVVGKIYEAPNGKTALAITAWWPAQRADETTTLKFFLNDGKTASKAYSVVLRGRNAEAVRWQLPEKFQGAKAKDIYCAFSDLNGESRLWRGDLRETVPEGLRIPTDFTP